MSIAYTLIIGRLWGSKPPGEKMDAALSNQARAKRKVSFRLAARINNFFLKFIHKQFNHRRMDLSSIENYGTKVWALESKLFIK